MSNNDQFIDWCDGIIIPSPVYEEYRYIDNTDFCNRKESMDKKIENRHKTMELDSIKRSIKYYEDKLASIEYDKDYPKYYKILQLYRSLYKRCENSSDVHDIERYKKATEKLVKTVKEGK